MPDDMRWSEKTTSEERCADIARFLRKLRTIFVCYMERDEWWDGLTASRAREEAEAAMKAGGVPLKTALRSAYSVMNVSLFAAMQHIDAIALMLEANNPPPYAISVQARSALEISGRAWWLADPNLDFNGRTKRALIERLASAIEVDRLETSGKLEAGQLGAPPTVGAMLTEIHELRYICNSRKPPVTIEDQRRPSATELIADFLKPELERGHQAIYRLLSAVAHGTLWGLMIFFTVEPDEMKRTKGTYRVTQNWLDGPACTVAVALGETLKRIVRLLGWDPQLVNEFLTEADVLFGDVADD
jgi:hypothetical protein